MTKFDFNFNRFLLFFCAFMLIFNVFDNKVLDRKIDNLTEQNDSLSMKIDSLTKEVYLMNVDIYD